jgi:hypothetical protein
MNDNTGYAVFFFPQALEALGAAIKPYLQDGPAGAHVLCHEIDTGGALIEMTIEGRSAEGKTVALELMVPTSMVRMIVSLHSEDATFGFSPREGLPGAVLPTLGPTTMPAHAEPQAAPRPVEAPPARKQEGVPEEALTRTPPKP